MSISYHGVVGHTSKVTLPSVDTWGANMNILRDPPRALFTRKIDKVGETSEITQMIAEAGDRACESILTYARGVNPMVSVSYDNYGGNGQRRNTISSSRNQAYLPYRVMDNGAFRPPVRDQRDLLPLSRLPRVATSSFSQPGFADFTKQIMCQGTDMNTAGVKKPTQMLNACIRPTAVYKLETPIIEPFEVRYVIKNPIHVSGDSGHKYKNQVNLRLSENPTSSIINNPMHVDAVPNMGADYMKRDADLSHMNTDRYTRDALNAHANTNLSRDIHVTPIEDLNLEGYTKEQFNIPYDTQKTTFTKQEYIHGDVVQERNLPYYEARTNIGRNIHNRVVESVQEREYTPNRPVTSVDTNMGSREFQSVDNITNRNYALKPTINAGGYSPNVGRTSISRENPFPEFDEQKSEMRRRIYEMQHDRNGVANRFR